MIIRTPRVQTPDTRQRLVVGKITKRAGRPVDTRVRGDRYISLAFCLLTPEQLDFRMMETHNS